MSLDSPCTWQLFQMVGYFWTQHFMALTFSLISINFVVTAYTVEAA